MCLARTKADDLALRMMSGKSVKSAIHEVVAADFMQLPIKMD